MTETVDATLPALDQPVRLDLPTAAFLPPPSLGQPALSTPPSTPAAPPPPGHPIPAAAPPPALIPAPVPAPAPPPALAPAPVVAPAPAPSPVAAPAPAPAPVVAPAPAPQLVYAPIAPPVAAPVPEPEPAPVAAPEPATTAAPEPVPEPEPEPEPAPVAIMTGPSAVFSTDAALMPAEHNVPMLPSAAAPAKPSAAPAAPGGTAFDVQEFLSTPGPGRKAPAKKRGRWLVRLLMISLLGGGGYMAYLHGPALYDEYVNKSEDTAVEEIAAPLAFPNVTTGSASIRTAEFTLDGIPGTPGVAYHVTTDFETDVSQVDITRTDAPDLQILTYADDAMIRRADGDTWYLLDRGQFPLDGRLERSDWVRLIDEFLPIAIRDQAVIDSATESTIAGVPTRHLSLTLSPRVIDSLHVDEAPPEADTVIDGLAPPVAEPLDLSSTSIAADGLEPAAAPTGAIAIEIWIDGDGLVRQITGAPQLGAETITIVRTSADAWIPTYPAPDEISALTASALVELGV